MKNLREKFEYMGILGDLREAMGVEPDDTSMDLFIFMKDSSEIVALWSKWMLGDEHWWLKMKDMYDTLEDDELTL